MQTARPHQIALTIDIEFHIETDTPPGKDPDTYSPTVARYHVALWSKALPNGVLFDLEAPNRPPFYLHHHSNLGEFWLSSDQAVHTYTRWGVMQAIIEQLPEEGHEEFRAIASTIGALVVWPADQLDRKPTINGAKGMHPRIADRLDLTLECVRRFYRGEDSPLRPTFERYAPFFALFDDFAGFVDFFLLQDLVTDDLTTVSFFLPFTDFRTPAYPSDVDAYVEYRQSAMGFVKARGQRIARLGI